LSDDEDRLREQLRRQEEEAERRAMTPKPNPLAEEHLRPKPSYETLEERNRTLERQIANISDSITKHEGKPREIEKYNGGPDEIGLKGNIGGLTSSRYVKHAVHKYVNGEWDEEDVERYFFLEAGWLEKAHLRARQIARFFKRKERHETAPARS